MIEAKEWINAQDKDTKACVTRNVQSKAIQDQEVTCSTDAAWRPDLLAAGLGWVFRLRTGESIPSQLKSVPYVSSPLIVEALAVREAMEEALNREYRHLQLCSDSSQLIQILKSKSIPSEMHGILSDIFNLEKGFSSICFDFIHRLENVVADNLAKEALNLYSTTLVGND